MSMVTNPLLNSCQTTTELWAFDTVQLLPESPEFVQWHWLCCAVASEGEADRAAPYPGTGLDARDPRDRCATK